MSMSLAYLNATADAGAALVTHIGLVDGSGVEVSSARQPVAWTGAVDGLIRPQTDLVFDIPAGSTVAGWRGFDTVTVGAGTNYGGAALTSQPFNTSGQYTLLAASTAVDHDAA